MVGALGSKKLRNVGGAKKDIMDMGVDKNNEI
jgi:hypothetical protein